MDYPELLLELRRSDAEVAAAYRIGSRVYGSARPGSDEDFLVVLADPEARPDLIWGPGVNVILHGRESFQSALGEHSMLAIECFFAPAPHRLKASVPAFRFALDRRRLLASVTGRSESDFAKASRRLEEEPEASRKKMFHALRVAMFGLQVARTGRLLDYAQASPLWSGPLSPDAPPEGLALALRPLHRALLAELSAACGKRAR